MRKLFVAAGLALALSANAFAEEAGQCAAIEKVIAAAPDQFVAFRGPQDRRASPGLYRTTVRLPGFASCRINTRELVFYTCLTEATSEAKALENFDVAFLSLNECRPGWETLEVLPEGVPLGNLKVATYNQRITGGKLVAYLRVIRLHLQGRDYYHTSLAVRFVPDEVGV